MKTLWLLYCLVTPTPGAEPQEWVKIFDTPAQCLSQSNDNCQCLERKGTEKTSDEPPTNLFNARGPTSPSGGFHPLD